MQSDDHGYGGWQSLTSIPRPAQSNRRKCRSLVRKTSSVRRREVIKRCGLTCQAMQPEGSGALSCSCIHGSQRLYIVELRLKRIALGRAGRIHFPHRSPGEAFPSFRSVPRSFQHSGLARRFSWSIRGGDDRPVWGSCGSVPTKQGSKGPIMALADMTLMPDRRMLGVASALAGLPLSILSSPRANAQKC